MMKVIRLSFMDGQSFDLGEKEIITNSDEVCYGDRRYYMVSEN